MNHYSIWRYMLLIVLVAAGLIYAAPNMYGEDYALQVSAKNALPVTAELDDTIQNTLKKQNIPFKSVNVDKNSYLVRFKDANTQRDAQVALQATLGSTHTIALNLAEKTPKWLQSLGAHPMRLGLDLRGGIHFLIYVNVKAMLKTHEQQDVHAFSEDLRQKMIRYSSLSYNKQQGIVITFRNQADLSTAYALLTKNHPTYLFTRSANKANFQFSARMSSAALLKLQEYAVSQNINILRNRIDELGVSEPVIQQQGKNYISVDLPGIQDTARAKNIIGKVATISLRMVDITHNAQQVAESGIVPFGVTLFKDKSGPVLVKNNTILSGSSITGASTIIDENGRPAVSIQASGGEVSRFYKVTANNIGKPMATIYTEIKTDKKLVDGKIVTTSKPVSRVISIATIQAALSNSFQITGMSSNQAAKDLALQLRSGAYVAPIVYVQQSLVAPSLGKDNIHRGILSIVIGSLLVIVFMAIYYTLFGLVADIALLFNVVFIMAVMSIIQATLTLPAIAGIVLTVGMAVDANVLINERIREELRNGMSPQASIHAGYSRAFVTIVDSHVTTFIVALVLYALGSGDVKGFALTLMIGILFSMVTAIFFTRAITNLIYGGRNIKKLWIGIRIPSKGGSK